MALLNRFSRLNDRAETGVFTFIVTKSVTRDFHRDATTKDFCFGYHRWAISFQRPTEKVLGVHLLLRNPSANMCCVVDFSLTLLNRNHFSQNQVYSKRRAKFTVTNPMQGVSRWIQLSELVERRFSNETGEFLFELSLSNMATIFECDIQLSSNALTHYKSMLRADQSSANTRRPEPLQLATNYFTFGAFDWSLAVVPLVLTPPATSQDASQQSEPVCRVYLNRLSGFDALCRVRYRVILGHHQSGSSGSFADSRQLDQLSDSEGRIRGYQFRNTNILKLIALRSGQQTSGNTKPPASSLDLRVHIELLAANTVSEARVSIQRKPNEPQTSNCSDRNKQNWCVEADCEHEHVRLKLFFLDLKSVPRNHIRYISWIAYLVRRDPESGRARESLAVRYAPHSNYYLQDGMDLGAIMDTDVAVKELAEKTARYLEDNQLTVHIEWVDSLLLFSHLYNNYDSLATIQRHQIRRELSALQFEFERLERRYAQSRRELDRLGAQLSTSPASSESTPPPLPLLLPPQQRPNSPAVAARRRPADGRSASFQLHGTEPIALQPQYSSPPESEISASTTGRQPLAAATQHARLWQCELAVSQSAGVAQQQTPMSRDDRLQFSSSTPPAQVATYESAAVSSPARTTRRRLPQQPDLARRDSSFVASSLAELPHPLISSNLPVRQESVQSRRQLMNILIKESAGGAQQLLSVGQVEGEPAERFQQARLSGVASLAGPQRNLYSEPEQRKLVSLLAPPDELLHRTSSPDESPTGELPNLECALQASRASVESASHLKQRARSLAFEEPPALSGPQELGRARLESLAQTGCHEYLGHP